MHGLSQKIRIRPLIHRDANLPRPFPPGSMQTVYVLSPQTARSGHSLGIEGNGRSRSVKNRGSANDETAGSGGAVNDVAAWGPFRGCLGCVSQRVRSFPAAAYYRQRHKLPPQQMLGARKTRPTREKFTRNLRAAGAWRWHPRTPQRSTMPRAAGPDVHSSALVPNCSTLRPSAIHPPAVVGRHTRP